MLPNFIISSKIKIKIQDIGTEYLGLVLGENWGKINFCYFCRMLHFLIFPGFKHFLGLKMIGKSCEILDFAQQFQNGS